MYPSKRLLCVTVLAGFLISESFCFSAPKMSPMVPECGFKPHEYWQAELQAAIARGEIPRPNPNALPLLPPREAVSAMPIARPCLTPQQFFLFEDTNQLLLTHFSDAQLTTFMITAANALLAAHGDNYDFIGFFLNFAADHEIGAAFYQGWENDALGLGLPLFNDRAEFGIAGNNIEGFVMMWNINSGFWQPGTGPSADFTRLALAQEYEHRFGMFLPNLADGTRLQGDDIDCGRLFHWNWKVDGQGSGMEIANWVGSNPAVPLSLFIGFNTDIPNSVFSYTDLYLMGYVTPAEMDAGNSELRYMNTSDCANNYNGAITNFTSADIVATAGSRVPNAALEDKHYRTGWIMVHLPGSPPTSLELNKAVGILEQHQIDWNVGTLGRGTMNDTLFTDCNCNGVADSVDIANGEPDLDANGIPDICEIIVPPVLAASPNNMPKQKYVSIDASVNGTKPLAIRIKETTSGNVKWAGPPSNGVDISNISPLSNTPFVNDWSAFSVLNLTGCIIQPFGVYDITFIDDPLGAAVSSTPLVSILGARLMICAWGDIQVGGLTCSDAAGDCTGLGFDDMCANGICLFQCDVGIGDIVLGINIVTAGAATPNTHGDVQGDIANGELDISDIVAIINSVTAAPGTTPGGYTPLLSCP